MTPDDVRDLFEGALRARRELRHMRYRMEALKSPVFSSGMPQAVQGGKSDPTADAGSTLADLEEEYHRATMECRRRIDEAAELIQGMRHGLGMVYADLLQDYYLDGRSWAVAARLNRVSKTTALRYRDIAFDWVASVGPVNVVLGDPGRLQDPRTA